MVRTLLSALLVIGLATLPSITTAQEDSLVLYLPFDTETKDEIKDLSKHGNHATVSGDPELG